MAAKRSGRLRKVASEFSLGINTIREFLVDKGFDIGSNPNAKITEEMYGLLEEEFQSDKSVKEASEKIALEKDNARKERKSDNDTDEKTEKAPVEDADAKSTEETPVAEKEQEKEVKEETEEKKDDTIKVEHHKPKVLGKVDLEPKKKADEAKKSEEKTSTTKVEKKESQEKPKESTEDKKAEAKSDKATDAKSSEDKPSADKEKQDKASSDKADSQSSDNKKAEKKKAPSKKPAEEKAAAEKTSTEKTTSEDKDRKPGLKVHGKIELDKFEKKKSKPEKEKKPSPAKADKDQKAEEKKDSASAEKAEEVKEKSAKKEVKEEPEEVKDETIKAKADKLKGPKVLGKIELPKKKVASSKDDPKKERNFKKKRKKRKRIKKDDQSANEDKQRQNQHSKRKRSKKKRPKKRQEPSEEDIQKKMKETLKRLEGNKSTSVKHRKNKRKKEEDKAKKEIEKQEAEKNTLKVTEFVTASELANMLGVDVNEVIKTCMSLGLFVSINQRLDAETITVVAEEFNYEVEFVSAEVIENISESAVEDKEEDYEDRSPIVTVMGHVDHGKTSLLDFIRHTNVIAGESGGITQHIGAYEVEHESGNTITFLDTPGHEAFTAMRARGSKITDIAVIVIAADDRIMPQTKEAINHAQAAGVPIVFAINKIDRPHADPEKIKEELAQMNLLVEDWGGKYQSQDISAKQGTNVDELLEKIILESELLELKGNPKIPAEGVVLEASLDKGRGYVAKLLVQNGSLKVGDTILAGTTYGRVKAMFNERNKKVDEVGPSQPALVLGLHNAPQAGDSYQVMLDEKEAKTIANKREQLQREQGVRTQKHITLDEIGRRLAIGDFQELNIIVKGDVDGSVEALADSLIKLSTKEIQVNVIHKSVGQVNEADIMLAAASDAIIVAFQVRPSLQARKLAETEQIDIRTYSIIYKAIEEVKDAMEGMLSPDVEEKTVCTVEVRDVFKITKVGQIAGCYVLDGVITRNTNIRVIRDGIVVYTGKLGSLKRFKDDVKEVKKGYECGLNIENFNDIKVGDIIEGYEEIEVKRTLD